MDGDSVPGLQTFIPTSKASSDNTTNTWPTHDRACSHCRERKIRCGRERPQCANCERDGVECGYYAPGKRVNHIKLLCNNVGNLENRLHNIEGELSSLTNFLKAGGNLRLFGNGTTEEGYSANFPEDDQDTSSLQTIDRHIVRSQGNLIDHYHGPWSLFALCKEICNATIAEYNAPLSSADAPELSKNQDDLAKNEAVKVLTHMCLETGSEEPLDLPSDHVPTRLPPKQFLMMAQTQFFEQADYTTDIFVQSCFWYNVERVYSQPFTPADEAWAICFNTIILLALGSEASSQGNDPLVGSQFAQPFLSTVRTAVSNPHVFMTPILVNVQALALLSIAARQYYSSDFAASIFAQACMLARKMGLHQTNAISDSVGPAEAQERFKVFRSLYIRDKSFSISRSSICWLPSFDCRLSSQLDQTEPSSSNNLGRIKLASLEEEIYQLFHSIDSPEPSSAKYRSALARIDQDLESWAFLHDIFSLSYTTASEVELQLEFLAARICAFRGTSDQGRIRQALNDARASCLLLLISNGKHDQSMVEQYESLPLSKCPSKSLGRSSSPRSRKRKAESDTESENIRESAPLGFHNLLDTFSEPAFFLLVRNILWPASTEEESQAESDIDLLRRVCACYKESDERIQANNHTRKVRRAFESLLEVVNLLKNPRQSPTSSDMTHQNRSGHTPPNSQGQFGGRQDAPDFTSLQGPSDYPTPSTAPSGISSSKNKSSRGGAGDTANMKATSRFLLPVESEYTSSQATPPQQQTFSPLQFQQQILSAPSGKRTLFSDLQEPMTLDDYPDSGFLSDFLAANPTILYTDTVS